MNLDIKTKIEKAVSKGDVKSAIDLLQRNLNYNPIERLTVLLLSSRFQRLEKSKMRGTISDERYNLQINRITENILQFCVINKTEKHSNKNVMVFTVILAIALIVFIYIKFEGYNFFEKEPSYSNFSSLFNDDYEPTSKVKLPELSTLQENINNKSNQGIFITKIINPPRSVGKTLSTVWLKGMGNVDYYIESIRIRHIPSNLDSAGHGAIPPAAEYTFSYSAGSNELHALNPALSLKKGVDSEIFFTLGLSLNEGELVSGASHIEVILYYHDSEGTSGELILSPISQNGIYVSKLINHNIKINQQIITPQGWLKGISNEERDYLSFRRMTYDFYFSDIDSILINKIVNQYENRKQLNSLIDKERFEIVLKDIKELKPIAMDICAFSNEADCRKIWHSLPVKEFDQFYGYMFIQHAIWFDDVLPEYIVKNKEELEEELKYSSNKVKKMVQLLSMSNSEVNQKAINILNSILNTVANKG